MGRVVETAHKTATSKSMEVAGERAEMPYTKDVEAEPSGEVQGASQQVAVQGIAAPESMQAHELPVVLQSIWDTGANQIINKQNPSWFMPFHRFETLVAQAEFQGSAEGQKAGQQLHQAAIDGETEQVKAMLSQR